MTKNGSCPRWTWYVPKNIGMSSGRRQQKYGFWLSVVENNAKLQAQLGATKNNHVVKDMATNMKMFWRSSKKTFIATSTSMVNFN